MSQSALRAELVARAKRMKPVKPKLIFGKYKGKTLAYVLRTDPEYILWMHHTVAKCYRPVGFEEAYKAVVAKGLRYIDHMDEQDLDMDDPTTFYQETHARQIADE